MAIRVVVFDIGGILEVIPGGGDPTRLFAPMMATWEARLHLAPGELDARLEELEARLASEGKDGSIGTCTEEEWQEGVRQVTGMDEAQMAAFLRDFWDVYMGNPNDELIAYFAGLHSHCRTRSSATASSARVAQKRSVFTFRRWLNSSSIRTKKGSPSQTHASSRWPASAWACSRRR